MKLAGRLLLATYGLLIVGPLLWVLMSSLKEGSSILASPWTLPSEPQWKNFPNAWNNNQIGQAFINSLLVTIGTLAVLIPVGSMAAYVFARFPFKGSGAVYGTFISGMMFPQFLTIVPLFLLMQQFHLLDNLIGLTVVYIAYSLSFTIFVLRGFFEALPRELAEASALDGCGDHRTFWQVMLPLAKPGLIVVTIFNAIGLWNEYSLALVLTTSDSRRTLPVRIANMTLTQQYQSDWGAMFAGLVTVILPVLIIYWLFKDRLQEAMLAGAVKG